MIIGKYYIEDWKEFSKLTSRRDIIDQQPHFDAKVPQSDWGIVVTCVGSGSVNPLFYKIRYHSPDDFLGKLHESMFGDTAISYASKEEAKKHVDMFLDKLQKLKAFL